MLIPIHAQYYYYYWLTFVHNKGEIVMAVTIDTSINLLLEVESFGWVESIKVATACLIASVMFCAFLPR